MIYKIFQIFLTVTCTFIVTATLKDYGNFDVKILTYSLETSSKFKPFVSLGVILKEYQNGTVSLSYYARIKKNLGPIAMKLRCYKWNEDRKIFVPSFNTAVYKVCDNVVGKELMTIISGFDKECTVKPGAYNFTIGNFNTFVHIVTNGKFFYGSYLVLTDIYAGRNGRVARSNCTALLTPVSE